MNLFSRLFAKRSEPDNARFFLGFQVRSALPIRAIYVTTVEATKLPQQATKLPEQLQLTSFSTTTPTSEREDQS